MNRLKHLGLLAATAIFLATTPSLAQTRDDRPSYRPQHEQHESDRDEKADEGRLPKGTAGTLCDFTWDDGKVTGVVLTNDTGKVIPAGTVITVHVQPGNIHKQYKVTSDWHSGQTIEVPVNVGGVASIAACSMKVRPERAQKPGRIQLDREVPWYEQGIITFRCIDVGEFGSVRLFNDGAAAIPAGTKIIFQLPDGQWYTYVLKDDWEVNTDLLVNVQLTDELKSIGPGEWPGCPYVKVETGYSGPGLKEQNPLLIDPSRIP